jgi:hypothetical protein
MNHTEQCSKALEGSTAAREAYRQQWPRHCTTCEGWGILSESYDPSPAGVSLGSGFMRSEEPCACCYENGICPRCGGEFTQDLLEAETPCPHCGFHEGTPGMPPPHECDCWEVFNPFPVRDEIEALYGSVYRELGVY